MTKEQKLEIKIWKGAERFAAVMFNNNYINKKKWYDQRDFASSVNCYICKELKIGLWKPKRRVK